MRPQMSAKRRIERDVSVVETKDTIRGILRANDKKGKRYEKVNRARNCG